MTLELPGVDRNDIKVNAYDSKIEMIADSKTTTKKYIKTFTLPRDTDIESAKSTFKNGILEVTFDRKRDQSQGKEINIE